MARSPLKLFAVCLILLAAIAACSDQDGSPPIVVPPTEQAVGSAATPSGAAEVAATPVPFNQLPTPVVLAPTATVGSSEADQPEGVEVTPTILLRSAADFGEDRNPLTGEVVDDPALLNRRPLAIKISNAPPGFVRPQHGLNDADLVFEHVAEGGVTRFTMIMYSNTPDDVGPIRSARLIDLELPAMYDAALVFSGASVGVSRRLYASDFEERVVGSNDPGYYRTGENKPFEHTLFGRPATFWDSLAGQGLNRRPNFTSYMSFGDQPPDGGQGASAVTIDFNWEEVRWVYDPEGGHYLRWAAGEPHLDGNSDEQVRAANVVIIIANHVEDPTICEEIRNGACTHLSIQAQIWGTGPAIILRDGQRYDVTWQRVNRSDMLTFIDSSGGPFPLQIGNSWFEIVPTWYANPISVEP